MATWHAVRETLPIDRRSVVGVFVVAPQGTVGVVVGFRGLDALELTVEFSSGVRRSIGASGSMIYASASDVHGYIGQASARVHGQERSAAQRHAVSRGDVGAWVMAQRPGTATRGLEHSLRIAAAHHFRVVGDLLREAGRG